MAKKPSNDPAKKAEEFIKGVRESDDAIEEISSNRNSSSADPILGMMGMWAKEIDKDADK